MRATGRLSLLALLALLGCSTQAGDVVVADASAQPPVDAASPPDAPSAMDRLAPSDAAVADTPSPDVPALDLPTIPDVPRSDATADVPADAPRRCQGPSDCMGNPSGALCDVGSGRCVACLDDLACPADAHCLRAEGRCATGCSRDEGCAATPDTRRCDTAEHRCVACLTDEHCAGGTRCVSGQCRPACDGTRPCGAGLTCCDNACVDITATLAHCGACGARCAPALATGVCRLGRCAVMACDDGRGDCDNDPANGCEVDTRATPAHCGACGRSCAVGPRAVATCAAGLCGLRCETGAEDCDRNAANGCEVLTATDPAHCGSCGARCALANATATCAAGRCAVAQCTGSFRDCDGDPANGCERDTASDLANCGACGTACAAGPGATASCAQGRCATTCAAGLGDCDGSATNGCEATLASDLAHCGACGARCAPANATGACAAGRCDIARCATSFADCNGSAADGCEADLRVTNAHCGRCGNPCAAGLSCVSGACQQVTDPTMLRLDVRTHTASGTVTMNGATPTSTCSSSARATVRFVDAVRGYDISIPVPCNGGNTPFTFSGTVFPGTYRVTVTGGLSSLPGAPYVIDDNFVVTGDRTGLVFDVRTHTASGTVTMNGAMPTSTCSSSARATVRFVDAVRGYDISIPVPCNGGNTPFTFSGTVFPGTYRVTVTGGLSSLPGAPYVIDDNFVVTGDRTGLVFDVRTHTASGTVTMNGAMPTSTCSSSARATVRFVDAVRGYDISIPVPCNGGNTPFTFSGTVFPGTYRVTVTGGLSSLPGAPYVIDENFVVTGDRTGLVFDVRTHVASGTVTMNGAMPTSTCSSSARATVRLVDARRNYDISIPVPCNGGNTPFTFSGTVFPGTYRVTVTGGLSSLPGAPYVIDDNFVVTGDRTGLVFDVRTHVASGTVTMNGAMPTSTCSSSARATVRFVDTARGYDISIPVPCNGGNTPFTFSGTVFPGTYRVTVTGGLSSLPGAPYVIDENFVVAGDRTGLVFDVRTITVSGLVLQNGAMPTSTCSSSARATVRFVDARRSYDISIPVPCNGGNTPFTFSGTVFPGTYRVTVTGGLSSLPGAPYVVYESLSLGL